VYKDTIYIKLFSDKLTVVLHLYQVIRTYGYFKEERRGQGAGSREQGDKGDKGDKEINKTLNS
jgi:hypothetical protein